MTKFWRNDSGNQIILIEKGDRLNENTLIKTWHQIGLVGSVTSWFLVASPLAAQITPDGTLETEVNTTDNVTEITGGKAADSNLFHSFQDFSVESGNTAVFNNAPEINNIIGRVTGGNISNIDGLIKANGSANLILINPQGISFGDNASLDIGGSFLGSSANSIVFQDGTVFNTDISTQPLLTISTPVGLQLGNSASIQVSGTEESGNSLEVRPGNTFALVGNGITFNSGTVIAESGRIDLGSVVEGTVSITDIEAGWELGYEGVTQFGSLELLAGTSLLNPNLMANSDGGIQIQGSQIVLERSQIAAQTLGANPGANIVIDATESLSLSGVTQSGVTSSQISNDVSANATGQGGGINITTGSLNIEPRSFIGNTTFGAGNAANIEIAATELNIEGTGFEEFQQTYRLGALEGTLQPGDRITGIFAGTATTGKAGDIKIETNSLSLNEGAIIFNSVFTSGIGGNIDITAAETALSASALEIAAGVDSTLFASPGDINLATENLQVSDGATLINLTFGEAPGGDINVTADNVDLRNSPPNSVVATGIITSSTLGSGAGGGIDVDAKTITIDNALISSTSGAILPPEGTTIATGGSGGDIKIRAENIEATGLVFSPIDPELAIGSGIGTSTFTAANGGNLTVATGKLTISGGAEFTSRTFGAGNGGELTINATDSIELIGTNMAQNTNPGGLIANSGNQRVSTEFDGNSGNISISTPELTVRDGATIDVKSISRGKAGSLNIIADSVLLDNLGALSATTIAGAGGDITIETNTLKLNGGLINASVFGTGTGGNIEINAKDSVEVVGSDFEFLQSLFFDSDSLSVESLTNIDVNQANQGILAATTGSGEAGEISITTSNLLLRERALFATSTAGGGMAGSIELDVGQTLTVDGSIISASTLFTAPGGDIKINTNQLEVLGGSQINSASLGSGKGGNVTISAAESVKVAGFSDNRVLASSIGAGAQPLDTTTGNGGDLTINTANLNLDDGGVISVGSSGTGNAGILNVSADEITLDNQSIITADTQSGGGGNIILNAGNIFWQGGSFTTATAGEDGDGGNITINADNLVALEGSRVAADAFRGAGGNIEINTQGLFICGECQISASSSLGVDGIIDVETLEPTTLNTLNIPQQLSQTQEVVAVACPSEPGANASQLTITGRGGLPNRPQEQLTAQSMIEFEEQVALKDSTARPRRSPSRGSGDSSPVSSKPTLPLPAHNWYQDAQGNVILTSQAVTSSSNNSATKSVDCPMP